MATINTGPTPVNTGTTTTTIGPLDRSPGAVPTGVDPAIPTPTPVYYQPLDLSPGAVTPGPGLGINPTATPAVIPPVVELPVQEPVPEGAGANVSVSTPIYVKVSQDGTLVVERTTILNFLGNGVSVSADGSTANITITAGSGGNGNYGNSNVVTLLSAFGSNTVSTTGNITGGNIRTAGVISATGNITGNYFIGNGSQLTGVTAGAAGGNGAVQFSANGVLSGASGFSYNTAANAMFVPTLTASGNSTTGINAIYGGVGGYVVLGSSVMAQFTGNVNSYSQVNLQNINSGNLASGDYILTADNGTDSTYYLDLGLAGSGHDDPEFFGDTSTANDGYLYVTATDQAGPSGGVGNLILGSTNGVIKLFVGNTAQANVIATVDSSGLNMSAPVIGNGNLYLQPDPANAGSYLDIYLTTGPDIHIAKNDSNVILGSDTGANVTIGTTGNVSIQANTGTAHVWTFDSAGQTVFPVLSTQRGDITSGTISGYTLNGGDGSQEFIITTPDGDPAGASSSAQRIVINPGAGNVDTSGEGGDIYLWAGRGGAQGGSGGDIKIRGGQGMGEGGAGGYIRMEAGDGDNAGGYPGYIEITGGAGGTSQPGGYIRISGGTGDTNGGEANIAGGYGQASGGTVNITGGGSAAGLATYGNVNITSGASTWRFDNDGVLTLPGEGVVRSNDDTIVLQSWDTANSVGYGLRIGDQGALYLEQGSDPAWLTFNPFNGNAEITGGSGTGGGAGKNITITAGAADQTDYYTTPGGNLNLQGGLGAGNDGGGGGPGGSVNITSGYSNDPAGRYGNVTINTGISTTWNFDYTGNLTLPGNLIMPPNTAIIGQAASPAPTISGFGSINSVSISTSGNILTSGYISAAGNITGNNISGNLSTLANSTATFTLLSDNTLLSGTVATPANFKVSDVYTPDIDLRNSSGTGTFTQGSTSYTIRVAGTNNLTLDNTGKLSAPGAVSAVGNVTGGNVLTGGLISATANITGGNLTTANLTSTGSLSITGNTATVTTANYSIGYLNIPQISLAANTTTALTDSGKHYYSTSASNLALTIANNTSVSWPVGTAITIVNRGTANITIAGGTGVSLYLSGNSTAGNRTVTTYGMATVMNVAANIWMINGTVV